MDSFKTAFLVVTVACCFFHTMAQLPDYKTLELNDLNSLCIQNGVNDEVFKDLNIETENILEEIIGKIPESEILKTDGECGGSNLTNYVSSKLEVIKKCLQGDIIIVLSDNDVEYFVQSTKEQICAFARTAAYGKMISNCTSKDVFKCRNKLLSNLNEDTIGLFKYAFFGLTSKKGQRFIYNSMACLLEATKQCDDHKKQTLRTLLQRLEEKM